MKDEESNDVQEGIEALGIMRENRNFKALESMK